MMDNDQPAVVVEDLHKSFKLPHEKHNGIKQVVLGLLKGDRGYETQKVLKGLSFEIKKGEFFGIVGRNGGGKSTLLKTLAGIYTPDKGLIQINGSLTPFIELGVGFNPELTGRENVYMNGALLGFNHKEVDSMYDDIVNFAELKKFMDQKLKNYSSGMQVRLAFSIAIRAKSDILLLDEVLAVGDQAFQQKCYTYFDSLKGSGQTVILVTHDMSAVQRFCTKALFINKGRIEAIGSPLEIAELYKESNISNGVDKNNKGEIDKTRTLSTNISYEDDDKIILEFEYSSKENDEMYIGISVLSDGISVAEITTPLEKLLTKNGKLTYTISKKMFNGGVYTIPAALFKKESRELIAVSPVSHIMKVKGYDITKGAALKLPNTWEYE